jgi:hypothetical protein
VDWRCSGESFVVWQLHRADRLELVELLVLADFVQISMSLSDCALVGIQWHCFASFVALLVGPYASYIGRQKSRG